MKKLVYTTNKRIMNDYFMAHGDLHLVRTPLSQYLNLMRYIDKVGDGMNMRDLYIIAAVMKTYTYRLRHVDAVVIMTDLINSSAVNIKIIDV